MDMQVHWFCFILLVDFKLPTAGLRWGFSRFIGILKGRCKGGYVYNEFQKVYERFDVYFLELRSLKIAIHGELSMSLTK
jgi:hypothetical protein